jgi:hypothetical protein
MLTALYTYSIWPEAGNAPRERRRTHLSPHLLQWVEKYLFGGPA